MDEGRGCKSLLECAVHCRPSFGDGRHRLPSRKVSLGDRFGSGRPLALFLCAVVAVDDGKSVDAAAGQEGLDTVAEHGKTVEWRECFIRNRALHTRATASRQDDCAGGGI